MAPGSTLASQQVGRPCDLAADASHPSDKNKNVARVGHPYYDAMLILGVEGRPRAVGIKAIDSATFNDGIGERIVIETGRRVMHIELRFMDDLGRCGVDGPVEAQAIGGTMRLETRRFRSRREHRRLAVIVR